MMSRSVWLISLASVVVICAGCRLRSISFSHYEDRPVRVTHVHTAPRHICTHDCHEHYWDGARLVVITGGHHHGATCGHVWNGTHWVVVRKARVSRVHVVPRKVVRVQHVHGSACGCAFDRRGHKWIKLRKGHVHRRGCGHVHVEGRWTIRF